MIYDGRLSCYIDGEPDAFTEQLDLNKLQTILRDKIVKRPDRQFLIQNHILNDSHVAPSLQGYEQSLKKARLADNLNVKLIKRPGPLELVEHNILQTDPLVKEALKDGLIRYERTSFDAESGGSLARDGDEDGLCDMCACKWSPFPNGITSSRTLQCVTASSNASHWDNAVLHAMCQRDNGKTFLDGFAFPLQQEDTNNECVKAVKRVVALGEHGFMGDTSILTPNRLDSDESSHSTIADELMSATAQLLEGTNLPNECLDQPLSEAFVLCNRNEDYFHYDNAATHRSCPLFDKVSLQDLSPIAHIDSRLITKADVNYQPKYVSGDHVDNASTLTRSEPLINHKCVTTRGICPTGKDAFQSPAVNSLRITAASNRSLCKKRQHIPDVTPSKDTLDHAGLGEHLNGFETHLPNGLESSDLPFSNQQDRPLVFHEYNGPKEGSIKPGYDSIPSEPVRNTQSFSDQSTVTDGLIERSDSRGETNQDKAHSRQVWGHERLSHERSKVITNSYRILLHQQKIFLQLIQKFQFSADLAISLMSTANMDQRAYEMFILKNERDRLRKADQAEVGQYPADCHYAESVANNSDDDSPSLTQTDVLIALNQLKVSELKAHCRMHGLLVGGNKNDLIKRILSEQAGFNGACAGFQRPEMPPVEHGFSRWRHQFNATNAARASLDLARVAQDAAATLRLSGRLGGEQLSATDSINCHRYA